MRSSDAGSRPSTDGFILTSPDLRCNNNCIFCYENYREEKSSGVAPASEMLAKAVELVEKTGITRVAVSGGEPTLYPDLIPYVRGLKEQGIFVSLFTNGRSLRRWSLVERLIDAGVDHFHIPLHSDEPEMHDSISRRKGSFQDTVTGLANVKKAQKLSPIDLSIVHVMITNNYRRLKEFARWVCAFEPEHVLLSHCIIEVESPKEQLQLLTPFQELASYLLEAHQVFRDMGQKMYVENIPPCALRGREEICLDFHKFNRLKVTGVKAESREGLKAYKPLRQSIRSRQRTLVPQCDSCVIKPYCGGLYKSYVEALGSAEISPYSGDEIRNRLALITAPDNA